MITNRNWKCKLCRKDFEKNTVSYYCTYCDYDVCSECMSKLSDEKKYPFITYGKRKSRTLKSISDSRHNHSLIYCNISGGSSIRNTWLCDNCQKEYHNEWFFYCSICDYNLCYKCLFEDN